MKGKWVVNYTGNAMSLTTFPVLPLVLGISHTEHLLRESFKVSTINYFATKQTHPSVAFRYRNVCGTAYTNMWTTRNAKYKG